MSKKLRGAVSSILIAGLLVTPAVVLAASNQIDDITSKVSYNDLDIESAAGAKELYERLKQASEEACDLRSSMLQGSMTAASKARKCYNKTLSAAVEKIDSDTLTDIHSS